jgi:hypothetical protein
MCIADRNERRLVHELAETMAVRRWPDHPGMWDFIRDAEPLVRRFHEQEASQDINWNDPELYIWGIVEAIERTFPGSLDPVKLQLVS